MKKLLKKSKLEETLVIRHNEHMTIFVPVRSVNAGTYHLTAEICLEEEVKPTTGKEE